MYTTKETQTWKSHEQIHRQFAGKKYNKFDNKWNLWHYQEITYWFDCESQHTIKRVTKNR